MNELVAVAEMVEVAELVRDDVPVLVRDVVPVTVGVVVGQAEHLRGHRSETRNAPNGLLVQANPVWKNCLQSGCSGILMHSRCVAEVVRVDAMVDVCVLVMVEVAVEDTEVDRDDVADDVALVVGLVVSVERPLALAVDMADVVRVAVAVLLNVTVGVVVTVVVAVADSVVVCERLWLDVGVDVTVVGPGHTLQSPGHMAVTFFFRQIFPHFFSLMPMQTGVSGTPSQMWWHVPHIVGHTASMSSPPYIFPHQSAPKPCACTHV